RWRPRRDPGRLPARRGDAAQSRRGRGLFRRGAEGDEEMISKIIEFSVRNRFIVLLLTGALAIGGLVCLFRTPVDAIPDLSENQVIVWADWPGRSPKEIEDQITYP